MDCVANKVKFTSKSNLSLSPTPDNISVVAHHFYLSHYNESLFAQLNISLPDSVSRSVKKRQAEFLAGRYTAREAIEALGQPCGDVPIGQHRNPLWPSGILASITHTNTRVVCAATQNADYQYLGIDLEKRLAASQVAEIKNSIINCREHELLMSNTLSFEDVFTLTFSAKESLFKALYPSVGHYFDFSAAEITNISENDNTFELMLLEDLTPALTVGMRFVGRFTFNEQEVFTMIAQA